MIFLTGILREGEVINFPYNMSTLYIMDASSVSTWLVDGLATVTVTSLFLFSLACCAVGNMRLLLHQQIVYSFHNRPLQRAVYQGCKLRGSMIYWWPRHGQYEVTYFYLVWLLSCRKYEVTDMWTKRSFISQHTSANPNTVELFVPYLETKENELTAEPMVYVRLQIEQCWTMLKDY
jgi:hypothetical protein